MDDEWIERLTSVVAGAITELTSKLASEPVAMFAVDCQPWQGQLYLGFLKQSEVESDPILADPAEMAAWELYDGALGTEAWDNSFELASEMLPYYTDAPDKKAAANSCFTASASAVKSLSVQNALNKLSLAENFRISVAHPDDGTEFYLP